MVEICSSSTHPTTTTFTLTTDFALNHKLQAGNEPLPSLEGCGFKFKCLNSLRNHNPAASTPPLSVGMWAAQFARWRNEGERYTRGDPWYKRPSKYIQKMNHDEHCGSFSSIFQSFHQTDCLFTWCPQTWAMTFIMVHFCHTLLILSHRLFLFPMPVYTHPSTLDPTTNDIWTCIVPTTHSATTTTMP